MLREETESVSPPSLDMRNPSTKRFGLKSENSALALAAFSTLGVVHRSWATRHFSDHICLFIGGSVLYIVRDVRKHRFSIIRECFIHGIVDGEAFSAADAADFQDVVLIYYMICLCR